MTVVSAPAEWVEFVADLRLPPRTDRRLQELMDRNNEGQLGEAERAELESLVEVSFIAEQSGFTRTWHQGTPLPEPAVVANAWDQWPHLFGSVICDPREKLYR